MVIERECFISKTIIKDNNKIVTVRSKNIEMKIRKGNNIYKLFRTLSFKGLNVVIRNKVKRKTLKNFEIDCVSIFTLFKTNKK